MNCSLADRLLDDYLDDELPQRDRIRLETHLATCPRCTQELRTRSSLDRSLRQALGTEIHNRLLSPAASARMVEKAKAGLGRSIWSHRARSALGPLATAITVALVLVGLSSLLRTAPAALQSSPVTLTQVRHLIQYARRMAGTSPIRQPDPEDLDPQAVLVDQQSPRASLVSGSMEPSPMHPGERFTITLAVQDDMLHQLQTARFDLEINGPTGYYRFPLSAKGPFPANGISVISVTPQILADQCHEKYLIDPVDIFGVPGVYVLRLGLFVPAATLE